MFVRRGIIYRFIGLLISFNYSITQLGSPRRSLKSKSGPFDQEMQGGRFYFEESRAESIAAGKQRLRSRPELPKGKSGVPVLEAVGEEPEVNDGRIHRMWPEGFVKHWAWIIDFWQTFLYIFWTKIINDCSEFGCKKRSNEIKIAKLESSFN